MTLTNSSTKATSAALINTKPGKVALCLLYAEFRLNVPNYPHRKPCGSFPPTSDSYVFDKEADSKSLFRIRLDLVVCM